MMMVGAVRCGEVLVGSGRYLVISRYFYCYTLLCNFDSRYTIHQITIVLHLLGGGGGDGWLVTLRRANQSIRINLQQVISLIKILEIAIQYTHAHIYD